MTTFTLYSVLYWLGIVALIASVVITASTIDLVILHIRTTRTAQATQM